MVIEAKRVKDLKTKKPAREIVNKRVIKAQMH